MICSNPDQFDILQFNEILSKIDKFLENNYNFSDKGIKKFRKNISNDICNENNEISVKSFLSNFSFDKDTYQYIVRIKDEINKRIENENKEKKDQDKLLLIKDYNDLIKFFNIFNIKEEEIKNEVTNNKFLLKFDINKYFIKELRRLIFSEEIIFYEELKEEIKQLEYREKFLNASIKSFNQEDPDKLRDEELERSEFIKDSGRIFYINLEEKIKNFTLGDFFIEYIKHIISYKEKDINNIFSNSKEKDFILEEILDNIEKELNIKFIEKKRIFN